MTLFKRVFNAHTPGGAGAPGGSGVQDEALDASPFEDDFALELDHDLRENDGADDGSCDAGSDHSGNAKLSPKDPDDGYGDIGGRAGGHATHSVADDLPASVQSMADRATQAQEVIALSKVRRAVAQERPATPDPEPEMQVVETAMAPTEPTGNGSDEPAAEVDEAAAVIAARRPGREARRVRTRMLGFGTDVDAVTDPFARAGSGPTPPERTHPVGWLVVVDGPGTGHALALFSGVSTIGRGSDQSVALDFGDTSISRQQHAAVAYDDESNRFYLGHGGKSNIVRLNGRPVLSTEDLVHEDTVRVGETTLRFVALCGTDFAWRSSENADT